MTCATCSIATVDPADITSFDATVNAETPSVVETTANEKTVTPITNTTSASSATRYASPTYLLFKAHPVSQDSFCVGSKIMTILAILTWIGGLIVSFTLGRDRNGNFDFGFFIVYCVCFGVAGGLQYALGELMQNVASIASSLRAMIIEQTNK